MAFGSASPNRSKAQGPWLLVLLFSAFVLSLLAFHYRWDRPITTSPIKLPKISYRFVQHPDLLHFDQATQSRWNSIINEDWWNMKWKDESSGQVVTRGVDMLHKLHCLIALREEFTMLVNDPSRHLKFQAEDVGSTDMRLHLGHCFDFLRQDILCAADDTLEPLDSEYTTTNGIGLSHQCSDWSIIMRHAGTPDLLNKV